MFTLALTAMILASSPVTVDASTSDASANEAPKNAAGETADSSHVEASRLRRYLSRPLAPSGRFLDHGVLQVGVAGGWPHVYRWDLSIGVFDYFSGGVTAHWLEGQDRPQLLPHGAIAVWRRPSVEAGLSYRQVMHTPDENEAAGYRLQTHYMTGTFAFSQGPFSAGVDVGAVYFRDDSIDPMAEPGTYRWRMLPGGGLFARVGTRRWGVSVQGNMPVWTLDFMVDLRFGLFEMRPRGGWAPRPR